LISYFVQEAWGPQTIDEFNSWENMWPELRSFARRVREIALRMRMLNQLADWNLTVPRAGFVVKDPDRLERAFRDLPDLLLLYARNVVTKSEAIRRCAKVDPQPRGKALELVFANDLTRWVRQKTGHRYADHVAAIQRVTYREAGRAQLPASGETLRKRELRGKIKPQAAESS
jgi:hypothetical protein